MAPKPVIEFLDEEIMERIAFGYIHLYYEDGASSVKVPFQHVSTNEIRTYSFVLANGQWIFIEMEELHSRSHQ